MPYPIRKTTFTWNPDTESRSAIWARIKSHIQDELDRIYEANVLHRRLARRRAFLVGQVGGIVGDAVLGRQRRELDQALHPFPVDLVDLGQAHGDRQAPRVELIRGEHLQEVGRTSPHVAHGASTPFRIRSANRSIS